MLEINRRCRKIWKKLEHMIAYRKKRGYEKCNENINASVSTDQMQSGDLK